MWLKEWEKVEERNYYIWCLKGEDQVVIVDAGVTPELAEEKEIPGYINPVELLSRIEIDANDVRHVVITHTHWDHVNGLSLFPNATSYIQEEEYRFWLNDSIATRPPFAQFLDQASKDYLNSLAGTDRLTLIKGDKEILPGVECLLAPGHSVALQALAAITRKGTAVLGSDCAHLFRNYREDWPSSLFVDLVGLMKTYDKLFRSASAIELVFPGHDPIMATNYQKVADDVTLLV
jgi:glyoxylase-like metal-dependent hydrolase (beta-lactamase superfamily II)